MKSEASNRVMQFFSSLADQTRLNIILSIARAPKNVGEIHKFVGEDKMTLSAISHQLKQLNDVGIIRYEKKGKEKFFELSDKFCWCVLRDAFEQFGKEINIKCKKCSSKGGAA